MSDKPKYEIIAETEKTITFICDGKECCYAKACYSSIDEVIAENKREREKWKAVGKRIARKRAKMTEEERARQDEADRAIFERWQDEGNTNAVLGGYLSPDDPEAEFNPWRKDED